jgi:hypothetical protein
VDFGFLEILGLVVVEPRRLDYLVQKIIGITLVEEVQFNQPVQHPTVVLKGRLGSAQAKAQFVKGFFFGLLFLEGRQHFPDVLAVGSGDFQFHSFLSS